MQVEGRGHKPGSEMTIRYHERADDLTKTLECGFKKGYAACKEIDVIHVVKNKKAFVASQPPAGYHSILNDHSPG